LNPPDEAEARKRAVDLLEAHHVFPGEFSLSAIALGTDAVTAAILKAASGSPTESLLSDDAHEMVPSSGGKYISHRLRVFVQSAADVLDLFARLRAVEGVVTVL
jgi:putative lipoic acid-binding regulatory protein